MKERLLLKWSDLKLLFRSIPGIVICLFTVAVVSMNLLANKTIYESEYLAIDGGILISWLSFLCMDIVTKHFGPKASNSLSIFALLVNLLLCLIFYIISIIPTPNHDYTEFNNIFGGTWFVLLSSSIAFLASAFINNILNWFVGGMFKKNPDGKVAFITRSYVSTFIAQFLDNLIFAMLTFMVFAPIFWDGYHWTFVQCVTCSLLGAALELVMEVIFSPFGYMICKKWKKEHVGEEYLNRKVVKQ